MPTLQEIEALFVGKTVKSVNLAPRAEYSSTQIYSITFTDGSTIHFGGEHDCAYLDGWSQDGEYLGISGLVADDPEEEAESVATPAPAGPPPTLLRDVLPPEYIPWFEKAKPRYASMLDYEVLKEGVPWAINNVDAKGMMRTFVLAWPIPDPESPEYDWRAARTTGRKTMVGIRQAPWEDAPSIIFADTHDEMGAWAFDFRTTLTG